MRSLSLSDLRQLCIVLWDLGVIAMKRNNRQALLCPADPRCAQGCMHDSGTAVLMLTLDISCFKDAPGVDVAHKPKIVFCNQQFFSKMRLLECFYQAEGCSGESRSALVAVQERGGAV